MSLLLLGKGQTKCLCYKTKNLNNHARLKHMLMKRCPLYHSQFNFQNLKYWFFTNLLIASSENRTKISAILKKFAYYSGCDFNVDALLLMPRQVLGRGTSLSSYDKTV